MTFIIKNMEMERIKQLMAAIRLSLVNSLLIFTTIVFITIKFVTKLRVIPYLVQTSR